MKVTFLTEQEVINGFKEFCDRNMAPGQEYSRGGRIQAWNNYMGHLLYQDKIHGYLPYPFPEKDVVNCKCRGENLGHVENKQRKNDN